MSIVNKMYLKDSQGGDVEYDIGAAAENVSYTNNGTQTTVQAKIDSINNTLNPHLGALASDSNGVHGIKYSNGLKVQDGSQWRDVGGSGGDAEVVDIKGARITSSGQTVSITCSDPDDSRQVKTQIRRKVNSAPTDSVDSNGSPNDGDFVADWTTKNTQSSTALTDSNKTIGTLYYYRFFIGLDTDGNGTVDKQIPGSSVSIVPTQTVSYGDMLKSTYDPDNDGIIAIGQGGTGNNLGYIQTGYKAGTTKGSYATIEGYENECRGQYNHAEGYNNTCLAMNSGHVEGTGNYVTFGNGLHAEGYGSCCSGSYGSHAEGYHTTAGGSNGSHSEGQSTYVKGESGHAEGNGTTAFGRYSHAEGLNTYARDDNTHAEGEGTCAFGSYSHAQGDRTKASGFASFSSGFDTEVTGEASFVGGKYIKASGTETFVYGKGKSYDQRTEVNSKGFTLVNDSISKFPNASSIDIHNGMAFGISTTIENNPSSVVDATYGCTITATKSNSYSKVSFSAKAQAMYMVYIGVYPSGAIGELPYAYDGGAYLLLGTNGADNVEYFSDPIELGKLSSQPGQQQGSKFTLSVNASNCEIAFDSSVPNNQLLMVQVIRIC